MHRTMKLGDALRRPSRLAEPLHLLAVLPQMIGHIRPAATLPAVRRKLVFTKSRLRML